MIETAAAAGASALRQPGWTGCLLCGLAVLSGCAAEHVIGSLGLSIEISYAAVPPGSRAAAVADFDGDGRGDVAVLDGAQAQLCWLAGTGTLALAPARCQPIPQLRSLELLAAVQTRQGPWSLVAAGAELVALAGRGDGTFAVSGTGAPLGGTSALVVADASGDGSSQVILSADRGSATVSVWPLQADAALGPPIQYRFSEPQRALLFQDLDADGRPELVGLGGHGVTVYGARGVAPVVQCAAGPGSPVFEEPTAIAALDLDGDGSLELLVADAARGGLIALRRGDRLAFDCGTGTLLASLKHPIGLLGASFDGNDASDLLALGGPASSAGIGAPSEALLFFGGSRQSGGTAPRYLIPGAALSGALGDLDGDGRKDAVVVLGGGNLAVLRNAFLPR